MQLYDDPPPDYADANHTAQIFRWGAGKCGPRLIQDLGRHGLTKELDFLTQFPVSLLGQVSTGQRHSWIIDLLHNEDFEDSRVLRACCELTRLHVEMTIDYANDENISMSQHCLSRDKLHHFQLLTEETVQQPGKYNSFNWVCSQCPTTLVIRLRAPEFPFILLEKLYKIRPQSSFSNPTAKMDAGRPSRFSTLFGLEYLLRNTAQFNIGGQERLNPREIAFTPGSMFEQRVGHEQEVIDIMKSMMFTFCPADHEPGQYIDEDMAYDEMQVDGVDWVFRPADPTLPGIRSRYRRLRLEMQILACKAREDLRDVHRDRPWLVKHEKAEPYMYLLMDAARKLYAVNPSSLNIDENTAEELCYHKLGIVADCTDKFVIDFYGLQCKHDQPRASYYLAAMEAIAKKRNSVALLTELQRQKSMGAYTRLDLQSAYSQLLDEVIESRTPYTEEDDETLINIAASMMIDNDPLKHRLREALAIVAKERDSAEIRRYLNTPDRDFEDISAALRYLGAEDGTDDEFLITLYDLKVEENPRLAKAALETIADERKNVRLRRFIDTGDRSVMPSVSFNLHDLSDTEMLDPDLAYSRLGVDDRATDDDMLIMLYEIRVADDPEEGPMLKRALELLGETRKSSVIKSYLDTGTKEVIQYIPPAASIDCPVGLENIGNTCYLNSLLQYYFTIKPLRDAILNHDGVIEDDVDEEVLKRKKVGGRSVSREEIERALRFIRELRILFRSLINSSEASLKPSRAVCFLALVSQKDETSQVASNISQPAVDGIAQLKKGAGEDMQSSAENQLVLSNQQPSDLMDGDDAPLAFNTFSMESEAIPPSQPIPERRGSKDVQHIIGFRSPSPNSSPGVLNNEITSIFGSEAAKTSGTDHANRNVNHFESVQTLLPLTGSTSPDNFEHVEHIEAVAHEPEPLSLIDAPALSSVERPSKRRQSSLLWSETNDWGRQQDVAECIDNVLFQLEAAFRPTSFDQSGEQVDLLKDLFYGITKQTLMIAGNEPKYERFSNTIVTLEKDAQDIYQALDGVFDLRQVELGGAQVGLNLTIEQAPPILQIQIQRVGFDLKSMSAVKSNIYLALDQSIYMDRYLESDSSDMNAKRQEYWKTKQRLAEVAARRTELQALLNNMELVGPQHNDHLWSATENEVSSEDETEETHLEQLRRGSVREVGVAPSEPPPTKESLEREIRANAAEERDLSYQLSRAFEANRNHEYRLHSVFIHRGEASHGHYWVYIYDFILDKWRKYNDEEVSDVSREEIMRDRKGDNENPYMLSYVRADRLHLTEALERDMSRVWEEDSLL